MASSEIVQKMSKKTISMFGCCTDKNEQLFGIDREGCVADIMISLGVVKRSSKGKAIMSRCRTKVTKLCLRWVVKELNSRRCMGVTQTRTKFYLKWVWAEFNSKRVVW